MNIQDILNQYDSMFDVESLETIELYLKNNIEMALHKNQLDVAFTLLNEMIGFCRDSMQVDKGLDYCRQLYELLNRLQIEQTYEYATCLLNLANAYRAFGKHALSQQYFEKCLEIYEQLQFENLLPFANLYNNWALLYQETNQYELAIQLLEKALDIVMDDPIKQAISRTNLAVSFIQNNETEKAFIHLKKAQAIFEEDGGEDFHYNACLVALGDVYLNQKNYALSSFYYEKGLIELEKRVGKNDNYDRVKEKLQYSKKMSQSQKNIEACELFYTHVFKEIIETEFTLYQDRIAVGVVGEGSDCFGFDDVISADHDYGIGLCFWLTKEDYEQIGKRLDERYHQFVLFKHHRRGVFVIEDFYESVLQTSDITNIEVIPEYLLACATNGKVFFDPLGKFSEIREKLNNYYPHELWRKRLATAIHNFSQYAQSNYSRMMARKDTLTANLCIYKAIETALDLIYLFNKQYAPYYKWKKEGIKNTPLGKEILPILNEISQLETQKEAWENVVYDAKMINEHDQVVILFDRVAFILLEELKKNHLVNDEDVFLEKYVMDIANGSYMALVNEIVELEWRQFDLVDNIGGRASCQDDYSTFSMMRKSQYMTWPKRLLESYKNDLIAANQRGWNLITEKYGRMMASTSPVEYGKIKDQMPLLSQQRINLQEQLIQIQVAWMEEFKEQYPNIATNARVIHTYEDQIDDTSYETYLRGEISTYSDQTIILYGRMIVDYVNKGRSYVKEIMTNTIHFYGYLSLEDAKEKLSHDSND